MKKYMEKMIVPFVSHKKVSMKLGSCSPALTIFNCCKGRTTPGVIALLEHTPPPHTCKVRQVNVCSLKEGNDWHPALRQTTPDFSWYWSTLSLEFNSSVFGNHGHFFW